MGSGLLEQSKFRKSCAVYLISLMGIHDARPTRGASQVALAVKNLPANTGDVRDKGSMPWSGRSPGGGHGNPLQYSCLENPMDRGAWQATVHRVAKSWTQLKRLSMYACMPHMRDARKCSKEQSV